ncbi:Mbov_0397 family ICE element conjugal transfer ATPase [Mesomycoplasma neurolyticum]|uniref:Conjugal transfer ATP-binding protein TraC n=1 Tax=Mesomycoplasma neurolyticum TaxID=2120 RepID=A0A449A622_9BACT|nr:DUF87 domain-containing protein [Mesomycoplasma neurolyticum]VEU59603.1 conjugal transfer ATP-binding protein TraC [Mesomycoplasma neurolyticum]
MKLQNKRIKNKGLKLWKFITLNDVPVLLAIFLTSAAIAFLGLDFLNVFIQLIIFIVLNLILFPLVFFYPSQQCKGYVFLYRWFIFLARPKKYKSNNKITNTSALIPYKKINENFIEISEGYFGALEITGVNISTYDSDEISNLLDRFAKTLNLVTNKISIVKLPKKQNLSKNLEFLKTNFQNQNNTISNELYKSYEEDIENIFNERTKDHYYIIVFDTKIEKLKKQFNLISQNLFHSKLENKQLTLKQLLNLTIEIINPAAKFSDEEIQKILKSKNIENFFKQQNIKFKASHFNINDYWFSTQTIGEYPFKLEAGWANKLFDSNSVVVWNLRKLSESAKKRRFNSAAKKIESNIEDEKNRVSRRRDSFEYQALDNIIDIASSGTEEIFESDFIFFNRALSKKELNYIEEVNKNNCIVLGAKINNLTFRQFEGLSSVYFKMFDSTKDQTEIISSNIAYGWPFANAHLNDGNYHLLGTHFINNEPLFFDQFKNDDHRKNNNMFILGTSGSGKSTLTNKIITYQYSLGNQIILIDPQNEYATLGQKLNASIINIGSGSDTTFNPLQIRKNFNPKTLEESNNAQSTFDNQEIMMLHEQNLEKFFETIFPTLTSRMLRGLGRGWRNLYRKFNISINRNFDISAYANEHYPTIDDLILEIKTSNFTTLEENEKLDLIDLLDYEFGKNGKLRQLYNGKTNFEISNKFTIFNVAPLLESASLKIVQAGFFLMMSFIQGQISNNINKKQKILFIVDEAHKFIDEKNTYALDIMNTTWKTIRKFNGAAIATTQNPRDFSVSGEAKRKSEAIVDNSQYAVIHNLTSKDIDIVDDLYKNSGGLTSEEKKFIANAKIGEFLFGLTSNQRFLVDSYFNDLEKKLYFKQGDKKNYD